MVDRWKKGLRGSIRLEGRYLKISGIRIYEKKEKGICVRWPYNVRFVDYRMRDKLDEQIINAYFARREELRKRFGLREEYKNE